MSTGFHDDYTSAIFGAVGDTMKKVALLASVPIFGHFIGHNCYEAPQIVSALRTGGFSFAAVQSALSDANPAMMPLYWLGTLIMSLGHVASALYLLVLAYAGCKIWLAEDDWWRGAAIILVAQPLNSWYVLCMEDRGMSSGDFVLSGLLIVFYEIAAIGTAIWFARQQDAVE